MRLDAGQHVVILGDPATVACLGIEITKTLETSRRIDSANVHMDAKRASGFDEISRRL